ncbi:hypothetical protein N7492_000785, partial [Penicillium capsulatum]
GSTSIYDLRALRTPTHHLVCSRWRGGPSRQSSQRHQNNANRDRASGGQGDGRGGNAAWAASGPAQEPHVPVRGFNAGEAKNILKKGTIGLFDLPVPKHSTHQYLINPSPDSKASFYKPTGKDTNNQRSGAPWGSKSNTMAGGKDFFVELRKQITTLQRSGPPSAVDGKVYEYFVSRLAWHGEPLMGLVHLH